MQRGRPARKGYMAGREIVVSPLFETQLRTAADGMNNFLQEKGIKGRVYTTDISHFLAQHININFNPEGIIYTGRKGKRVKFNGEIQL